MQLGVSISSNNDFSEIISEDLFGGNFLAHKYTDIDAQNIGELVRDLGVTSLRYPGGTITELYFDISDPDNDANNEMPENWLGLSDFQNFAAEQGLSINIVLPTMNFLSSSTDFEGNRYEEVDENLLREFVEATVAGYYGDAQINSFEIGNEYWLAPGMTSIEYGRVASRMAKVLDEELERLSDQYPDANNIDIVAQIGYNFGSANFSDDYDDSYNGTDILDDLNSKYNLELGQEALFQSGEVNWTYVQNLLVLSEFNAHELSSIDGASLHIYNADTVDEDSSEFLLSTYERTWLETTPNLETYVTEWNQETSSEFLDKFNDYGLFQAQEILETIDEFADHGVDYAEIWPLLHNTPNALSQTLTYEGDLTPSGLLFSYLSDELPGKSAIELVNSEDDQSSDIFLFYGDGSATVFVSATTEGQSQIEIDLSNIFESVSEVEAKVLTSAIMDEAGSRYATGQFDQVDTDSLLSAANISTTLDHGEILVIEFNGYQPTDEFSSVMAEIDSEIQDVAEVSPSTDLEDIIPIIESEYDVNDSDNGEEDDDDTDFDIGLLLMPLLLLATLAGI
ncbi:hypothetical protein [Pacificibacter marinus]|uniref:Intracellular exo-alpha-(1->5)-L-arabinofuranosidase n=1 Tax=Pacificibacter marinus TaxID=658057 RepID=A0A1Y5TMQ7_9RHOB|nr:hypothetical protein [Pacificibacter marinus]SEL27931.1 hypothetical protein SAMN04488032_11614 [Pacificibacter marinus]SLN67222.1 Intracellular exo-alpha-(1->5)-L-arabinofuranosidase [Pacificibacter marinus]